MTPSQVMTFDTSSGKLLSTNTSLFLPTGKFNSTHLVGVDFSSQVAAPPKWINPCPGENYTYPFYRVAFFEPETGILSSMQHSSINQIFFRSLVGVANKLYASALVCFVFFCFCFCVCVCFVLFCFVLFCCV